ncbi:hypothetical protein PIB30_010084 [Stylosanthes scabra]|uniref:Uncharacterized protein n=1 Tax=Stylosanthes scabra TaxID=79078 RepID=A0ABU6X2S5_9FABA|nr:hypothetical protein [Stylosanthes scabra]
MRPIAPRPPCPAGSSSSSVSSGSSGNVHREREQSPRTMLPPPTPVPMPGPMHPIPRTPMKDARHYRNLFSRHRVAPPSPPSPPTPPPSDDEPSDDGGDADTEDDDDLEDSYIVNDASLSSRDVSSVGASYGSERESTKFSSGPSDRFSSGGSSGGSSVGYGSVSSGSASDASSDDDLVTAISPAFLEWKNARREEVSEYQKQTAEQYLVNVEKDMERWQNARKARKVNNDQDLQESMDKELDTHRLEHGSKKRKIPGGSNNEDDEDVEDINIGEEDMMEDVLEDDAGRRVDEITIAEASNPDADPALDSDNVDQK